MRARHILILSALFLLSACLVQSKIQGRYVEDQGACRDYAESNIGQYEKPGMTVKDRNAQLVTLFADCMAKKGWQVAKPKRTTVAGPHGPLDPYPSAIRTTTTTTTTGPAAQPATQQPVGQQPVQTQSTPLSPSGSMPPLNPPVSTGPAYYQPGRNYTSPDATPYGTGAGRNF